MNLTTASADLQALKAAGGRGSPRGDFQQYYRIAGKTWQGCSLVQVVAGRHLADIGGRGLNVLSSPGGCDHPCPELLRRREAGEVTLV